MQITVTREMIFLNNRPVVLTDEVRNIPKSYIYPIVTQLEESLREAMAAETERASDTAQRQVILRVEQNVCFDVFVKVLNTISTLGVKRVGLATYGKSADDDRFVRIVIPPEKQRIVDPPHCVGACFRVIITDSTITLGAVGGFIPSSFYTEYHRYITKGRLGRIDTLIKHTPDGGMPIHPSGREFTIQERREIYLYVDKHYPSGNALEVLYTHSGEMLTNAEWQPLQQPVSVGDTVFALANPRRQIIVSNPADFKFRPLSVYDACFNTMIRLKDRFHDLDGVGNIVINVGDEVIFDKVIGLVDIARDAGFTNISIATIRDIHHRSIREIGVVRNYNPNW